MGSPTAEKKSVAPKSSKLIPARCMALVPWYEPRNLMSKFSINATPAKKASQRPKSEKNLAIRLKGLKMLFLLSSAFVVMGVPVTAFFGPQMVRTRVVFLRANERTRVSFQRGIWEGLGGEQFVGRVEPFMLTLESGASSGDNSMVHTGHKFVFCLRGQLEYQVEKEIYNLEPGDSLLFSAHLQHRWRNRGNTVTNVLILLSGFAEGERPIAMHLAAEGGN